MLDKLSLLESDSDHRPRRPGGLLAKVRRALQDNRQLGGSSLVSVCGWNAPPPVATVEEHRRFTKLEYKQRCSAAYKGICRRQRGCCQELLLSAVHGTDRRTDGRQQSLDKRRVSMMEGRLALGIIWKPSDRQLRRRRQTRR